MNCSRESSEKMARDFNEIIDDIMMAENKYRHVGFTRGFSLGEEAGWKDGYVLGLQRGAQIASELGFYQGFVHAWISVLDREETAKQRKLAALKSLLEMTREFPPADIRDEDLIEKLQKIRAKFKQVLSLLNLGSEGLVPEAADAQKPEMSF